MSETKKICIGVSACLLGQKVRYDGTHQGQPIILQEFSQDYELISVCPELEFGLGVPREKIQLIANDNSWDLYTSVTRQNIQTPMEAFAIERINSLNGISGYISKKKSPSCGVSAVKVFQTIGDFSRFERRGVGVFVAELMKRYPDLPLCEEDQLQTSLQCNEFKKRVHQYAQNHPEPRLQ